MIHVIKGKAEMAEKLKEALDDESKMQGLAMELSEQGYPQAAETIDGFRFDLWWDCIGYRASVKLKQFRHATFPYRKYRYIYTTTINTPPSPWKLHPRKSYGNLRLYAP